MHEILEFLFTMILDLHRLHFHAVVFFCPEPEDFIWIGQNVLWKLELVSKELNHIAAILHVYAVLWSKKKIVIILQKESG